MKITKRQLKRIIREQSHGAPAGWTKADWDAKNYNAGYEDALDGKEPDLNTPTPDRSAYARGYMAGQTRFMGEGQENKTTKITKRQLRRIIKEEKARLLSEALPPHLQKHFRADGSSVKDPEWEDVTPAGYGPDDEDVHGGSLQNYVNDHIDDFIDGYITKSSMGTDRFLEWWETVHCEENGIPCTQDHLAALVDRAEQMGEVEEGELFVGLRGT